MTGPQLLSAIIYLAKCLDSPSPSVYIHAAVAIENILSIKTLDSQISMYVVSFNFLTHVALKNTDEQHRIERHRCPGH